VPSIHAIGDVTDRVKLTPVALAEGMIVARNLFGPGSEPIEYSLVPSAVFSQPNVGTVGLTEAQARARHADIAIYKARFTPLKATLTGSGEKTFMKMIVDRATDRVLGIHMVGDNAGEIIQGMAVALQAGATKAVFDRTIGIHPTAAEEFVTMRVPV
jgi:glutathione reductase (NADPH)